MTNGEASEVQALLRWILALGVWEHDPDAQVMDDDDLIDTIGTLAERSHKVLGAGLARYAAEGLACRLVSLGPALDGRIVETVDVQGALL